MSSSARYTFATMVCSHEEKELFKRIAAGRGTSISNYLRQCVTADLERNPVVISDLPPAPVSGPQQLQPEQPTDGQAPALAPGH